MKGKVERIRDSVPQQVGKDVVKDIKKFIADNGGTIRKVLESGALWVMSDGAKEYIKKLKNNK